MMKRAQAGGRAIAVLAAVLPVAAATAAHAAPLDPPLAGDFVVSDTHGQPVCTTADALRRYTIATVRKEFFRPGAFPQCVIAPYATHVQVMQDLPPFGSLMHVVRVRASTVLEKVDGYTWSVGLYDARRFRRDIWDGDVFPAIP